MAVGICTGNGSEAVMVYLDSETFAGCEDRGFEWRVGAEQTTTKSAARRDNQRNPQTYDK